MEQFQTRAPKSITYTSKTRILYIFSNTSKVKEKKYEKHLGILRYGLYNLMDIKDVTLSSKCGF